MSYADFLATKYRRVGDHGEPVAPDVLHPTLHDWQAAVTAWAIRKGRAAIFADCGLGKTLMQIEWARHSGVRALIIAPLSVARQTVREAAKVDAEVTYVRDQDGCDDPGVYITNYEMADRFDPHLFDAVVLDESSILKAVDAKTRQRLTAQWSECPARLACTATPAPNDVAELANHAEFLGVASRAEMLSAYFVHESTSGAGSGWRLKGHAADAMHRWVATWACALRKPSDLGYPDDGYDLPPLNIVPEVVAAEVTPDDGQLFAVDLGGVSGRAKARKETLAARVERAAELANTGGQWIVWCGLNDEADACESAIDGAVNVPGSWAPEAKAKTLEAFQDGDVRVLVTKPSIAGFGMNFQNAHQMAFVGLSDSWESYYQCIRRCWRYGQTSPVDAHVIVSELEQQIADNVARKEADATSLASALAAHARREVAA
jgi:hypothetical protein